MAILELSDISEAMKELDICMMATIADSGALESRPMSNNRQIDYKGDSYFFADGSSHVVKELAVNPQLCLAYQGRKQLYISVSGRADLVRERAKMEKHWNPDIEKWFAQGLDTPGLTMIHVKADRIKYWQNQEEGEVKW